MNENIKRIMLVDDDADDRTIFDVVVKDVAPSIIVDTAKNGKEAIEKLADPGAVLPDLIFLDINMPVMNGFECLRELKKNSLLKHIPAMMYSTSCNEREVDRAFHLGACLYIVKPFSIDEYETLLKNVFSLDLKELCAVPGRENFVMDMKSVTDNH